MEDIYSKEITKLHHKLEAKGIPHTFKPNQGGYQIVVFLNDCDSVDAICHRYSIGCEKGLLEIMGGLTPKESKKDLVLGWLTAEEVLKRFEYCYQNATKFYVEEEKQ